MRKYHTEEEKREARRLAAKRKRDSKRLGLPTAPRYSTEKDALLREFRNAGCLYCGEAHHECLDAHHVNPTTKSWDVAVLLVHGDVEQFKEELAKCVCLCANCHRRLHAGWNPHSEYKECNQCHQQLPPKAFEKRWPSETRRATCRKCRGRSAKKTHQLKSNR